MITSKSLHIGIDFDETLADHLTPLLDFYRKKTGMSFRKSEIMSTSLRNLLKINKGAAIEVYNEFRKDVDPLDIPVVAGSQLALKKLSASNKLSIITSRPFSTKNNTQAWLNKNFRNVKFEHILFLNDEIRVLTKADLCVAKKIDILIEDNLASVLECSKQNIPCILINRPWNRGKLSYNVIRAEQWQNIPAYIMAMKRHIGKFYEAS